MTTSNPGFEVGDEVEFTEFEGSGSGIGIIKKLDGLYIDDPKRYPNYQVKIQITHTEEKYPRIGETWYFPFRCLKQTMAKYDPAQAGDKDEDI